MRYRTFSRLTPSWFRRPRTWIGGELVAAGLVRSEGVEALAGLSATQVEEKLGRDAFVQLVGRAELRALTKRAHALGKKVIFDLVLMQSSRDCPLIAQHPEWYLRDECGVPQIHQIAWLVYSDVALFDLVYNRPLQEYLLEVAPYWIEQCGFDGVRIDASQTIDRPFLKKLKNRIQAAAPEALVLGETLCPLTEAMDVPVGYGVRALSRFSPRRRTRPAPHRFPRGDESHLRARHRGHGLL